VSGLSVTAFQPNSDVRCLPQENGAVPTHSRNRRTVFLARYRTGRARATPRWHPLHQNEVLDRYGQSIEESARFSTSPPFFRRQSVAKCALAIDHNESIVEAIEPIDSIERRGYDLNGRHAFRTITRLCLRLTTRECRRPTRILPQQAGEAMMPRPKIRVPRIRKGSFEDYAFFFNPSRTASAVIGMWRTRTPTAL
jgi:hypothetical protein